MGNPQLSKRTRTRPEWQTARSPDSLTCIRSIVAVHGIGSHPEKAWVHKETSFNWLKALPEEEGINARVMVYYHNTQWESKSLALSLDDVAQRLLKSVISWRRKSDPVSSNEMRSEFRFLTLRLRHGPSFL